MQLPPQLNLSDDNKLGADQTMVVIHQKIQNLRSSVNVLSRKVNFKQCDFKEANAALKVLRHSYEHNDCEFSIKPFYIEFIKEAVSKGSKYSSCCELVLKYKYEKINNCCEINVKEFRETKNGFTVYAYCVFPTCNKLRFDANYIDENKKSMNVIVWSTNPNNKEVTHIRNLDGTVCQKRSNLRGIARITLATTKAYPHRAHNVSSLASMAMRDKTGRDLIPSPAVYRTAKSESVVALNRDTDPLFDLIKMKRENEDFIKYVSMPFSIELTYIPACKFYKDIKVHDMVYFDASGSTCGHPNRDLNVERVKNEQTPLRENKVLFYTTVAEQNESLLPLNMFITEDHSAHNIAFHLRNFKIECVENIAINVAYNGFPTNATTSHYLEFCYELITRKIKLDKKFIVVQGCCAHFARMVSLDLNKFPALNKRTKHLIQEAMAYATTTDDMEVQKEWWKLFCIIFGSKKHTPHVDKAISKMFSIINYNQSKYQKESMENEKKKIEAHYEGKIIYRNSPFYKEFKQISDHLATTLNMDRQTMNITLMV